jgi:hypothetical protein
MNERVKTGAVATLDVLGYVSRAKALTIDDTVERLIAPIVHSAQVARTVVLHDYRKVDNPPSLEWAYFADTFLFALPQEAQAGILCQPAILVDSMVFLCELLLRAAFLQSIPMRGAISFGEYCLNITPLYYLGSAYLEAHVLQEQQAWAGVCLCDSACALAQATTPARPVLYDVPVKNAQTRHLKAVNWCRNFTQDEPDWEKCFDCSDSKVAVYRDNTEQYFRKYRGFMAGGPIITAASLHVPKDWKALYVSQS